MNYNLPGIWSLSSVCLSVFVSFCVCFLSVSCLLAINTVCACACVCLCVVCRSSDSRCLYAPAFACFANGLLCAVTPIDMFDRIYDDTAACDGDADDDGGCCCWCSSRGRYGVAAVGPMTFPYRQAGRCRRTSNNVTIFRHRRRIIARTHIIIGRARSANDCIMFMRVLSASPPSISPCMQS